MVTQPDAMGAEATSDGQGPDAHSGDGRRMLVVSARLFRVEQLTLAQLPEPLTYRQFRILARVHEGIQSSVELGRRMRLTPPTVSQSVDGLVRRGLLERVTSPVDRRARILTLSPAGRAALTAAEEQVDLLAREIIAASPPAIRPFLPELLERMHDIATAWLDEHAAARERL